MHINDLRKKYLKKQEISKNKNLSKLVNLLMETKYVYHFNWLGVPTIQFPSDLIVIQEILIKYKPDIVIETGVAHGGSLLFYSSILSMVKKKYKVLGVDIKIKLNNKKRLFSKPLSSNIKLFEKNSIDSGLFKKIKKIVKEKKVIVILDSNHSHDHVLKELNMYSQLIKKNGYIIVMDTVTEFIDKKHVNKGRDFGKGNSPYTAVKFFLKTNSKFIIDKDYENKSLITSAPSGFIKKI
jgi:cephalosporin hydroxylase